MAPLAAESTTFTLDNMGRFVCNTLQEATDSAAQILGGRTREHAPLEHIHPHVPDAHHQHRH